MQLPLPADPLRPAASVPGPIVRLPGATDERSPTADDGGSAGLHAGPATLVPRHSDGGPAGPALPVPAAVAQLGHSGRSGPAGPPVGRVVLHQPHDPLLARRQTSRGSRSRLPWTGSLPRPASLPLRLSR